MSQKLEEKSKNKVMVQISIWEETFELLEELVPEADVDLQELVNDMAEYYANNLTIALIKKAGLQLDHATCIKLKQMSNERLAREAAAKAN